MTGARGWMLLAGVVIAIDATARPGHTLSEQLGLLPGCPIWYRQHEYDRAHTEARDSREPWPLPELVFNPKQWKGDANRCTCTALMTGPTILCPVHRRAT